MGAIVVIGSIIATVLLTTSSDNKRSGTSTGLFAATNPLADAATTCNTGTLGDNDQTLLIDMAGEETGSGTATIDEITCVLGELEAPQSVLAQMDSTRALDGMQSATWSTYKATWTYHPDNGLDLILTHNA
jgi:hypothetical protein